jgi:hypothetical protein
MSENLLSFTNPFMPFFKKSVKYLFVGLACLLLPLNSTAYAKNLSDLEINMTQQEIEISHKSNDHDIWFDSKIFNNKLDKEVKLQAKQSEERRYGQGRRTPERKPKVHAPHCIFLLYPRWFFLTGGILRGLLYYYIHLYSGLFLLWSAFKMRARMDFVFNPLMAGLDNVVRPLLNWSTKMLPFTGASGISAQIFLLLVSVAAKFIRTFIWIIYDTEFDYRVREILHTSSYWDPEFKIHVENEDLDIAGYQHFKLMTQSKTIPSNLNRIPNADLTEIPNVFTPYSKQIIRGAIIVILNKSIKII